MYKEFCRRAHCINLNRLFMDSSVEAYLPMLFIAYKSTEKKKFIIDFCSSNVKKNIFWGREEIEEQPVNMLVPGPYSVFHDGLMENASG